MNGNILDKPPKFGPQQLYPSSLAEWVEFYRWLFNLWRAGQAGLDSLVLDAMDQGTDNASSEAAAAQQTLATIAEQPSVAAALRALEASVATEGTTPSTAPAEHLQNLLATIAETRDQGSRIDDVEKLVYSVIEGGSSASVAVIVDTHANRVNYPASSYTKGAIYYESDRHVAYVTAPPGSPANWLFAAGSMQDVFANRPSDLGTHDADFLFIATDRLTLGISYWTGTVWHNLPVAGTDTQIQYAKLVGGLVQFAADLNLVWDYTNQIFQVTGINAVTGSFLLNHVAAPPLSGGGQARVYMDLGTNLVMISVDGAAYVGLLPTYPISVANGGTGDTSLTAHGVLIGEGTSPVAVTAVGTAGQVLTSNGAGVDPTFQAVPIPSPTTVPNGGTGDTSLTAHGVLIGEGTSPVAVTAVGTAGQVLTSNGAGVDPTFQAVTVPSPTTVPNGGTGDTSLTAHGVLIGEGTSPVAVTAVGTAGQVLTSNGAGVDPTFQAVPIPSPTTVPNGGTGDTSLTAHGVLVGAGTSPVAVTGTGTSGQVLTSNGSGADPTFQTPASSGITQLTGDVTAGPGSGSQAATLAKIQGNPVSAASPNLNQVLQWNGSNWVPSDHGIALQASDSSQLTLTSSYADVPGATITLTRGGTWLIGGVLGFVLASGNGAGFMRLVAGGSAQSPTAPPTFLPGSTSNPVTSQVLVYAGSNGDVVKLQAKSNSGGGATDSGLTASVWAIWIHP